MKTLFFFFLLGIIQVNASIYSQTTKLNLNFSDATVEKILDEYVQKTDLSIIYKAGVFNDLTALSIQERNLSIHNFLDKYVVPKGFVYEVENKTVIVKKAPEKKTKQERKTFVQQKIIRGKVTDEEGLSLPGVSVLLKGTAHGTVTDDNGNYTIEVFVENSTLYFSFVGFKRKEINVDDKTVVNVTLIEEVTALNEVVTTAKFITREKKSVGYAVQSIKGAEISMSAEPNLVHALAGQVTGVLITGGTSGMSGSSNIVIRGNSNLSGNNLPLFVIDGVPMYNDEVDKQSFWDAHWAKGSVDWGDPISKMNPEDIEELTVLKGAGATALYGQRASNGVILITTKKGDGIRKGIGINYSYGATFANPAHLPEFQQEYGAGNNGVYAYGGDRNNPLNNEKTPSSWGPKFDPDYYIPQFGSPVVNGKVVPTPWISHPNNVEDFWRTGILQQHNLSLTFGNKKAYGRVSASSSDESGMVPNTDEKRSSVNANILANLSEKWKVEIMANYNEANSDNRVSGYGMGLVQKILTMPSNYDMKYINSIDYKRPDGSQVVWLDWNNPYWELNENFNKYSRYNLTSRVGFRYEHADWLKAKLSVSKNLSDGDYSSFTEIDAALTKSGAYWNDGAYLVSGSKHNENNIDLTLFGQMELIPDLNFSYTIGANKRRTYDSNWEAKVDELATPDFANLSNGLGDKQASHSYREKENQSVFGLVSFGYKDYLYLDLTGRNDWSSTLPKESRSYFYPSTSLSFLLTEALDMKSDILSYGKLRASWAQVGADTAPYQLEGYYYSGSMWDGKQTNRYTSVLPPTNLKPQRTNSFEIGTELNFFDNRLNFDLALYKMNTKNQIVSTEIPRESGFYKATINSGNVENRGIELMVNAGIVRAKDFNWNFIVNASRNENKLVELADEIQFVRTSWSSMEIRVTEGNLYGEMWGSCYVKNPDGRIIVQDNGQPYNSGSYPNMNWDQKIGNAMPKFLGGITNSFRYKNFFLRGTINGRFGGQVYSVSHQEHMNRGLLDETIGLNKKGIEKRLPVSMGGGMLFDGVVELKDDAGNVIGYEENEKYIEAQTYYNAIAGIHETHLFDGSFLKLQEVSFSYRVPTKFIDKVDFIQRADLSCSVYNVATLISHIPNVDPEVTGGRNNAGLGIETGALPSPRRVNFKVSLKF